jgi:nucleotide-binding universal stress UspA family protein
MTDRPTGTGTRHAFSTIVMQVEIRKILVPTDFSECSRAALNWACDLARRYTGSTLAIVHVFQVPGIAFFESYVPASPNYYNSLLSSIDDQLKAWQALVVKADVRLGEVKSLEGSPVAEILRYAGNNRFELIVMGTHGRSALDRLWLGSVAENVVRRAPCPVLTVREHKDETVMRE